MRPLLRGVEGALQDATLVSRCLRRVEEDSKRQRGEERDKLLAALSKTLHLLKKSYGVLPEAPRSRRPMSQGYTFIRQDIAHLTRCLQRTRESGLAPRTKGAVTASLTKAITILIQSNR